MAGGLGRRLGRPRGGQEGDALPDEGSSQPEGRRDGGACNPATLPMSPLKQQSRMRTTSLAGDSLARESTSFMETPRELGSVETMGLEPTTPGLQSRCSSQLSYVPKPAVSPRTLRDLGFCGSPSLFRVV